MAAISATLRLPNIMMMDHYETQLMNWYGPGTGEYVEQVLGKFIAERSAVSKFRVSSFEFEVVATK